VCAEASTVLRIFLREMKCDGCLIITFLAPTLVRGEWSTSQICRVTPSTRCAGGWLLSRASLGAQKSCAPPEIKLLPLGREGLSLVAISNELSWLPEIEVQDGT
jgi:hypothetical protein